MDSIVVTVLSLAIAVRNLVLPDPVFGAYNDGGIWTHIFRVNTVTCRCVGAKISSLDQDKSLVRMIYFNLVRNVPNTIIR